MKIIKDYVNKIEDELESAQDYAEQYVYQKASGNSEYYSRYRLMSEQELDHAIFIHDIAVREIEKIRDVYQPSQEMLDKWNASHAEYVQKVAMIRLMLEK